MSSSETTPECLQGSSIDNHDVHAVPTIKGSKSSSDFSPNSQSSLGSPEIHLGMGRSVPGDVIDAPIFQVKDSTVFILMTFPTSGLITAVAGITSKHQSFTPQYKVASPYGDSTGFNFDERTRFVPGDYCLGLVFKSTEEAQSVSVIRILLEAEPVSNFMLSQMIFGLYRSLGFEPSHVMKYPTKSISSGQPFYRKIRNETAKVAERTSSLENQLTELSKKLEHVTSLVDEVKSQPIVTVEQIEEKLSYFKQAVDSHQEKGASEPVSFEMVEQLILEKETYLNKLREAEDFIDRLEEKKEKRPVKSEQWFKPSWDLKKSSRR